MNAQYYIQTADIAECSTHNGEQFLRWNIEIDDSVGAGKYNTYQTAVKHKNKFLVLWKRYSNDQISDLRETLRTEFKHLSKNDSRLQRATRSIENFGGIRILTHTLPTVVDATVLETK